MTPYYIYTQPETQKSLRYMKHRLQRALAILAVMAAALPLCAQSPFGKVTPLFETTVYHENGSTFTGRITKQEFGGYLHIETNRVCIYINPQTIKRTEEKKVKYEDLSTWMACYVLEHNLLQGSAYERYVDLVDIYTEDDKYTDAIRTPQADGTVFYTMVYHGTFRIPLNDVTETRKELPGPYDEEYVPEVVKTVGGDTYVGTVTRQKANGQITMVGDDWKVVLDREDIVSRTKDLGEKGFENPVLEQFTDIITFSDGEEIQGKLLGSGVEDGKIHYILYDPSDESTYQVTPDNITSIKTEYKATNGFTKYSKYTYLNNFIVPNAITKAEGTTSFPDVKLALPLPEGIRVSFYHLTKAFGTDWHLVPLERVKDARGNERWGYKNDMVAKQNIRASRYKNEEYEYSAEFDYLSPGYYVYINPDYTEHYVFKVTK